jgi:type IV pilus assembly protein PilP
MLRSILILALVLLGATPSLAADAPKPAGKPAASTATASQDDDQIPDAMKRLMKAPEVDYTHLRDPFVSYLVTVSQRGEAALREREARLSNRPREVLENFDLSTLKLVAIYTMGTDRVAMIQDATGKGYIVHRGNYMGKNNGRIEKIGKDSLYLVEQVLNPAGEITDRQVTLTLKNINSQ